MMPAGNSYEKARLQQPSSYTFLVLLRRPDPATMQVFFIDTAGALCSRSAGHAIDVEGMPIHILLHCIPESRIRSGESCHSSPTASYPSVSECLLARTSPLCV